ncbi:hypothetical protein [Burkholderia sp. Ac-20365]|uniref:hypothetical protein n=1 Tax=Burkholderia sp. Ac-20365 TaxID=2703897 RepID=UPI00197B128B|nr:hypothetical protein [Burkholderia sp. Ac-20365]MBN3760969.1 hypothetical protein [Burkholderia sp. Ac-20365]
MKPRNNARRQTSRKQANRNGSHRKQKAANPATVSASQTSSTPAPQAPANASPGNAQQSNAQFLKHSASHLIGHLAGDAKELLKVLVLIAVAIPLFALSHLADGTDVTLSWLMQVGFSAALVAASLIVILSAAKKAGVRLLSAQSKVPLPKPTDVLEFQALVSIGISTAILLGAIAVYVACELLLEFGHAIHAPEFPLQVLAFMHKCVVEMGFGVWLAEMLVCALKYAHALFANASAEVRGAP